jgi:AcrR family transcriptional regulator
MQNSPSRPDNATHPYHLPERPKNPTRARILAAAAKLFYRNGIRAVTVEDVAAAASVTKVTVYKHFGSKAALVASCLDMLDDRFLGWFIRQVEAKGKNPRARLLAVFDVYDEWLQGSDFRGCIFINSTVELADVEHPGYSAIRRHKARSRAYFRELAVAAGVPDPDELSNQWMLLTEGATVVALVEDDRSAAKRARRAAEMLLLAAAGSARSDKLISAK